MHNEANDVLKDTLDFGQNLVFCGTAAGYVSAQKGFYYAGPGNKFWRILYSIKLTPRKLEPYEFELLRDYSIGLTDIAKDQYGSDNNINFNNSQSDELKRKILIYQPKILCFNGKNAAKRFFKRESVDYGLCREKTGDTTLFIAPSTSGAANGPWDESYWKELAGILQTIKTSDIK